MSHFGCIGVWPSAPPSNGTSQSLIFHFSTLNNISHHFPSRPCPIFFSNSPVVCFCLPIAIKAFCIHREFSTLRLLWACGCCTAKTKWHGLSEQKDDKKQFVSFFAILNGNAGFCAIWVHLFIAKVCQGYLHKLRVVWMLHANLWIIPFD